MRHGIVNEITNIGQSLKQTEGYQKIESSGAMSVTECREFWNKMFEGIGSYKEGAEDHKEAAGLSQGIPARIDIKEGSTFSDLSGMKEKLGESYKEIKESKPKNSPNVVKWFESGGKIAVSEQDGKRVWTYINSEGIAVKYIDGYPVFPPETKHPDIGDISIGVFTGDRKEDRKLYLEILEDEYGLTEIPDGYVLHHDSQNGTMQLVKEEYHKEFTHAGGHSKFREDESC